MTEEKDKVIELNLGCWPEAAVSGALLLQTEYKAYLTFNAQQESLNGSFEDAGTAVVEIVRCGTKLVILTMKRCLDILSLAKA